MEKPLDRFLGTLKHKQVHVHQRAAQRLTPLGSAPNALHRDLLRLFGSGDRVRLVTTNFDHHFSTAYAELFGATPAVFRAPALPLGQSFSGIVHVHGDLSRPDDMVLTDADFGRGYLTEGWARRFLVDVFRHYTVLFVGYSHDDVVMNYLARALPTGTPGRFALTDVEGNWDLLGIAPVLFKKGEGKDAYSELYKSIAHFSNRAVRPAIEWQQRLEEAAAAPPPVDEEVIGEIEEALNRTSLLRLFLRTCKSPAWLRWLGSRGHLAPLFSGQSLDERSEILAQWVADTFAVDNANAFFEEYSKFGHSLNDRLWWYLMNEVGRSTPKRIDPRVLRRWVSVLFASVPDLTVGHAMHGLAQRCAAEGEFGLVVRIFFSMSEHRIRLRKRASWVEDAQEGEEAEVSAELDFRSNHWTLNDVWTKHLKPRISELAPRLLDHATARLRSIRSDLRPWNVSSDEWDSMSFRRSAIEPHEQDRYPDAEDILIDVGRDTVEWLAAARPADASSWIEANRSPEVPLLRRIAIHAVSIHSQMDADLRIAWLLDKVGLQGLAEHHEVFRLAGNNYADASEATRNRMVDTVMADGAEREDSSDRDRERFNWLTWLVQAKPDCPIATYQLERLKQAHPEWEAREQLDLTHWTGGASWVGPQSPWTVEELLAIDAEEQLERLLTYQGTTPLGPAREGLLEAIREATKTQILWALALIDALMTRAIWESDLWSAILRGWKDAEAGVDHWRKILSVLRRPEVHKNHSYAAANLLYSLVKDQARPFALEILADSDEVALATWYSLTADEPTDEIEDWLGAAINRPAGILAQFWIGALSLSVSGKSGADRRMPPLYEDRFALLISDNSVNGGYARSVLAAQTGFLLGLSPTWTNDHMLPLFSSAEPVRFKSAWDGFLTWGRMNGAVAHALLPHYMSALPHLHTRLESVHQKLIELGVDFAVFHADDPTTDLIPALFKHATAEDAEAFASQIAYRLSFMAEDAIQHLWKSWLAQYWEQRLQGVPAPLAAGEFAHMLDWLPFLGGLYPAAVDLALQGMPVNYEHGTLLYRLKEGKLPEQFPDATARLLIFLCACELPYQLGFLKDIAERLQGLAPATRKALDDWLVAKGVL